MFAFHGTLVHCQPDSPLGRIEFLEDRTLIVERRQDGGRIVAIEKGPAPDLLQRHGIASAVEMKVLPTSRSGSLGWQRATYRQLS